MIIDAISDLHGHYPKLEGGDLLIIAGDLTAKHSLEELDDFNGWVWKLKYKKKIVIGGNHDTFFELGVTNDDFAQNEEVILDKSCQYLCDSGKEFKGLKLWGTPWTKTFPGINPKCKAFTCDTEEQLKEKFDLIPDDIDILISHGPPYMVLDECDNGNVGSIALREALERVRPKLLICGHIHEQGGKTVMFKHQGPNTMCYNVSYLNECYRPVNKVTRIEI